MQAGLQYNRFEISAGKKSTIAIPNDRKDRMPDDL